MSERIRKLFEQADFSELQIILLECQELREREGDETFRNKAEKIYNIVKDKIVRSPVSNFYIIEDIGLNIHFIKLANNIGGSYSYLMRMITLNIANHEELYLTDVGKFLEKIKYIFIHEIIHFLDCQRGAAKYMGSQTGVQYNVNTPLEFNAYYNYFAKQYEDYLPRIKKASDVNAEFDAVIGKNVTEFINNFWDMVNKMYPDGKLVSEIRNDERYNFKWNKRLYQFYFELLSKLNKNKRPDKKTVVKI